MDHKPCDVCRQAFKISRWDTPAEREHKKNGPPCATCRPELLPDNDTAFAVYLRCADQLIVGPMGDKIGLNFMAVRSFMDMEGIPDQAETWERVQLLYGEIFRAQREDAERKREAERDKARR